jgi:hypothetical protein
MHIPWENGFREHAWAQVAKIGDICKSRHLLTGDLELMTHQRMDLRIISSVRKNNDTRQIGGTAWTNTIACMTNSLIMKK